MKSHGPTIAIAAASGRLAPPSYDALYRETPAQGEEDAPPRGVGKVTMVAVLGLMGLALSTGLLKARAEVVRAAPWSEPFFAAVGMPVNLVGVTLRNVKSRMLHDGDEQVLVVDGDLVNVRGVGAKAPDLVIAVRAADGREIYTWTAPPPKRELSVGESVYFRARLASPPSEKSDVKVRFAVEARAP